MCEEESRRRRRRLTAVLSTLGCSRAADRLTVWSGRSERCLHSAVSGHLSAVWLPCCWLKECLLLWRKKGERKKKDLFFFFFFSHSEENIAAISCSGSVWRLKFPSAHNHGFWSKLAKSGTRRTRWINQNKFKKAERFELGYLVLLIDFFFFFLPPQSFIKVN